MLTNFYTSVVSPEDSVFVLYNILLGNVQIDGVHMILVSFNSTVSLTCMTQGGPNNMFEWSRQGMIVSNSSVLELPMITGSDGGIYQCTVTNDAGSDVVNVSVIGMYFILYMLLINLPSLTKY